LQWSKVYNWNKKLFDLGGYSYSTLEKSAALEIINEGVANTIYFAGEAFYTGTETGTVEAALTNGIEVAKRVRRVCV